MKQHKKQGPVSREDLRWGLYHFKDEIFAILCVDTENSPALMHGLAACILHHPDMRAEWKALRTLSDGIIRLEELGDAASGETYARAYQVLSEGERWAGSYFSTLVGEVSVEELMNMAGGLGAILADHKDTAALGKMFVEMEDAYQVLMKVKDRLKELDGELVGADSSDASVGTRRKLTEADKQGIIRVAEWRMRRVNALLGKTAAAAAVH